MHRIECQIRQRETRRRCFAEEWATGHPWAVAATSAERTRLPQVTGAHDGLSRRSGHAKAEVKTPVRWRADADDRNQKRNGRRLPPR